MFFEVISADMLVFISCPMRKEHIHTKTSTPPTPNQANTKYQQHTPQTDKKNVIGKSSEVNSESSISGVAIVGSSICSPSWCLRKRSLGDSKEWRFGWLPQQQVVEELKVAILMQTRYRYVWIYCAALQ